MAYFCIQKGSDPAGKFFANLHGWVAPFAESLQIEKKKKKKIIFIKEIDINNSFLLIEKDVNIVAALYTSCTHLFLSTSSPNSRDDVVVFLL